MTNHDHDPEERIGGAPYECRTCGARIQRIACRACDGDGWTKINGKAIDCGHCDGTGSAGWEVEQ
jgi:hypothetical protein